MLPDMLLPPDDVEYQARFQSRVQIDNSDLAALILFAGSTGANYSEQFPTEFTFSRNGITIEVDGEDFVYSGGVPTGGSVTNFRVLFGNTEAYTWGDFGSPSDEVPFQSIPISVFLTATDPLVLAPVLFAQNDMIQSQSFQADDLYGYAGDDLMSGGNGENRLYGGDGNDIVYGGRDNDRIYGGDGDDWLGGGSGDDLLNGGAGVDTADYFRKTGPVVLKLKNEKAAEAHIGFKEVDKLKGIENVLGGLGADKLTGDRNNNQFDGDAGNDVLKGKGGNDTLAGGYGYDTLMGGKGNDVFQFDKMPALGGGIVNIDTIQDFQSGVDDISLRQMVFPELETGILSDENFLAAPGAIGGLTGKQYIVYDSSSGALYYDASGDGTGIIFQFAVLKGAPQLTASDLFVFIPKFDVEDII